MPRYYLRGFFISLIAMLTFISNADAIRIKTDWALRTNLSENIVKGEIINVRSYWNFDRTLIFTDVTILIDEKIKGADTPDTTVVITRS